MIDKTDQSGILVTLDEEKAFERVDHTFLMKVLIKFAFGPSFHPCIFVFYSKVFLV